MSTGSDRAITVMTARKARRRPSKKTRAVTCGTLIEMRFVRREERLARDDAAEKRERRVG
jgi:hypothetical protein